MDVVVARARACLGTRFRVHGRRPGAGLDCIGLAAYAFDATGVPAGYALCGGSRAALEAAIFGAGLRAVDDTQPGDLLVIASGPFQLHCAITTDRGFIHADASLRRVVEVPGRPRWPVLSRWRRA